MLITCLCGATNRLPRDTNVRARCGKCKHVFVPGELAKARPEPFALRRQPDIDDEDEDEEETCDECGRKLDEDGACPRCDD